VVSPVAGRWIGGWGTEFDQLGVEACRTASGFRCRMLGGGELGCPDASSAPRLGGWFTSWYLFAVDARMPKDDACAGTGYLANADLPLWKLGPIVVRSRPIGRIGGPPRPKVTILKHAVQRGGTLRVATLQCATRCTVDLTVFDAKLGISRRLATIGRTTVGVPRGPLSRGPLTVIMHVDDSPAIRGRSSLS
jgi:hypothetical protein